MLVNIHFQKWPLEFFNNYIIYLYSDKASGTEIKKKNNLNSESIKSYS